MLIIVEILPSGLYAQERGDSSRMERGYIVENSGNKLHLVRSWEDTTDNYPVRLREFVAPVGLVTLGVAGVVSPIGKTLRENVKYHVGVFRNGQYMRADDYFQYLPTVAYFGLDPLGFKAKHPFKERLAVGLTAFAVMGTVVNATKYSVREMRPDGSARNSFPSGHTAVAFTGAEMVREEYGLRYGIPAYVLATTIGFFRVYNERHWVNDVFAGAGVGILSARIGYWLLPVYRRWFGWSPTSSSPTLALTPSFTPSTNTLTLGCTLLL